MRNLIIRAAIPTILVAIAIAIAGYVLEGNPGLIGALVGAVIVLVFFTIGQVLLDRVIKSNPTMALTVALSIYLIKIAVLFCLLLAFKNTTAFNTQIFAVSVLLCTLVWTFAEVWAFSTAKVFYVEPGSGPNLP